MNGEVNIEFYGMRKGYLEQCEAEFNVTFPNPLKLYVEPLNIHYHLIIMFFPRFFKN